jgi:hypothetical protein
LKINAKDTGSRFNSARESEPGFADTQGKSSKVRFPAIYSRHLGDSVSSNERSQKYLQETQNLPQSFALSPNHCMFNAFSDIAINRTNKLSNPYLGERPTVPEAPIPERLQNFNVRKNVERLIA